MVPVVQAVRAACLVAAALYSHVSLYSPPAQPAKVLPLSPPLLQPLAVRSQGSTLPRLASMARMSLSSEPQETSAAALVPTQECPTNEVRTRELFKFILPTLTGWLSSEVMTVIDTAVVGSLGADQLAALSPATMLTDSSSYLFFWLSVATTSLFASHLAAGDDKGAYDVLSDALWCALGCGLFLSTALAFFGRPALRAICASAPAAIPAASSYLAVRLLGLPAFMTAMVLQAACLGAKDPKTPLLALGCSALVNLLLDVYLVRVVGMGIGGAALATLAAQVVQACMLGVSVGNKRVAALTKVPATGDGSSKSANANAHEHGDEALRKKPRLSLLLRGRPSWPRLLSFVSFAGPMAFVLFGKVACYNAMTLAATSGGVITLAAHQVLVCVFFLGCKFGDAVSQAAQAYLPSCVVPASLQRGALANDDDQASSKQRGSGEPRPNAFDAVALAPGSDAPLAARRLSLRLIRLAVVLGVMVAAGAYGVVMLAPNLFTSDVDVIAAMRSAAPLLAAALSMHACTVGTEGLLIGSRQLGFLVRAYAANIAIFLSLLLAIAQRGMGLGAVWSALTLFQVVRLLVFVRRGYSSGLLRRS